MKCPESIEELEKLAKMIPLCRVTLYEQAKAKIEKGAAKSISEASRQIGEETGRNSEGIRVRISEEQSVRGVQLSELVGTDKHRPTNTQFRTSFTGENEWYTPTEYIEAARQAMGSIDLDPATSEFGQGRVRAKKYYTKDVDGLQRRWRGNVWLNPPYSQPDIVHFIEQLVSQYTSKNITQAILLTHNYSDTRWFHMAATACACLCLTSGRIAFENQQGDRAQPTQGSTFFYFGENSRSFKEVFCKYGIILKRL